MELMGLKGLQSAGLLCTVRPLLSGIVDGYVHTLLSEHGWRLGSAVCIRLRDSLFLA